MPLRSKVAATFHLTQKSVAVALMLLSIMLAPALYLRMEGGAWKLLMVDLPIFLAGAGSMSLFYGLAFRRGRVRRSGWSKLILPLLTSLGIGLSVNNSLAILGALFGRSRHFVRTPKSGQTGNERTGLTEDILKMLDDVVEIPVYGMPHSFNAATAASMAMYEYCRQFPSG